MAKNAINYIWKDRKRTIFGLPWSFTRYYLTEEKLIIDTGFFNIKQEEIRLYRILDMTLGRTLGQRIFGLGTIHVCSADKTTPEFNILRIKDSYNVKELISSKVEEERNKKKVFGKEFMSSDIMDEENEHD